MDSCSCCYLLDSLELMEAVHLNLENKRYSTVDLWRVICLQSQWYLGSLAPVQGLGSRLLCVFSAGEQISLCICVIDCRSLQRISLLLLFLSSSGRFSGRWTQFIC
jgi:hypothetical protein